MHWVGADGIFTSIALAVGSHWRVANKKDCDRLHWKFFLNPFSAFVSCDWFLFPTLISDAVMNIFRHKSLL